MTLRKIRGATETLDVWQHEGITQELSGEIWGENSWHQQLQPLQMPQNIINRMTVESVSSSGFLPWTHHANVSATTTRRRLLLLRRPRGVKMDSRKLCNFYRWTIEPVLPSIGQGLQLGSHPWFVTQTLQWSHLHIRTFTILRAFMIIYRYLYIIIVIIILLIPCGLPLNVLPEGEVHHFPLQA